MIVIRRLAPSVGLLAAALALGACETDPFFPPLEEVEFHSSLGVDRDALTILPGGVGYEVLRVGEGTVALESPADHILLDYRVWLADGTLVQEGTLEGPLEQAILGFWEGVRGMVVGEERLIVVPPDRAYAAQRQDGIPPWSWLVFRVELRELDPAADDEDEG